MTAVAAAPAGAVAGASSPNTPSRHASPPNASAPASAPRHVPAPARSTAHEQRQQGHAFDNALQRQAQAQDRRDGAFDSDDDSDDDTDRAETEGLAGGDAMPSVPHTPSPPAMAALAGLLPPPGFAAPKDIGALPSAAPSDANVDAARAAFGAAPGGDVGAMPANGAAAGAAAWQVSLNDPRGVALLLQASRGGSAGGETAPWTLTIGSGVKDASLLAQHAPRLNERLRARAVTLSHVRIEADDDDAAHSD